jgi:ribonuclease HI
MENSLPKQQITFRGATMKRVTLYTDGACSGNPGPGGWACVLIYGDHVKELSGFSPATTNNRMELQAVIEGLDALKEPCIVDVYCDSAYVVNAIEKKWIDSWKSNGWMTKAKKPVENQDLWRELLHLLKTHQVNFVKVAGHAGIDYNERCDALARGAIKQGA